MKNKQGFIAIITVLLISVVSLTIAVSVTLLGIDEAQNSLDFKKGLEAFKLAEACGDEGMLRSRNSDTYTGGTLTFPNGQCTVVVTDTPTGKQVDATGVVTGPPTFVKNIRIVAEKDGNGITVVTWQELN